MEQTLEQFRSRTGYIFNPLPREGFDTAPGCAAKVSAKGELLPFYGDTTIFDLAQEDIFWLKGVQDALYEACGDVLAQRLRPQTYHITLHDLLSAADPAAIEAQVHRTLAHAQQIVREIRASFPWGVHVRAARMMNMVNTSVVLVFEPVDDDNCRALMQMYERLQEVVPLSYPLTPHVTLAYFRPGRVDAAAAARLQRVIDEADVYGRIIHLDAGRLNACTFTDMNHYHIGQREAE